MNSSFFRLSSSGLSDTGLVRTNNEDVFLILKEQGFFALADGMGGHNAGEVAATEAMRFLSTSIEELFISSEKNWNIFELSSFSRLCIENVNSWVHYLGNKKEAYQGMGTTLCTLLFYERFLIYGHVGDSRIYLFRNGHLEQLTEDHSLKNQMVAQRYIENSVSTRPVHKNILTRAIGTQNEVDVEIHIAPVTHDDVYLMCTDGLTDQVSDREIEAILQNSNNLEYVPPALIKRANGEGGQDNVTVLMVKAEDDKEAIL